MNDMNNHPPEDDRWDAAWERYIESGLQIRSNPTEGLDGLLSRLKVEQITSDTQKPVSPRRRGSSRRLRAASSRVYRARRRKSGARSWLVPLAAAACLVLAFHLINIITTPKPRDAFAALLKASGSISTVREIRKLKPMVERAIADEITKPALDTRRVMDLEFIESITDNPKEDRQADDIRFILDGLKKKKRVALALGFEKAHAADPLDEARALVRQRKYTEALDLLDAETGEDAALLRGWCLKQKGKYGKARSEFAQLSGGLKEFYLARVLEGEKKFSEAAAAYEKLGKRNNKAYFYAGYSCKYKLNDAKQAYKLFAKLAEGNLKSYALANIARKPRIAKLTLVPDRAAVEVGKTVQFNVTGLDQYGDAIAVTLEWETAGGTLDEASGVYTAGREAGTFTVAAKAGGVKAEARVVVTPAPPVLAELVVTPKDAKVEAGKTAQFAAVGKDQYGNAIAVKPIWSAEGGTIDENGLFTAGAAGGVITAKSGTIVATAKATLRVLTKFTITPEKATVIVGETRRFTATGLDQFGEEMDATPEWSAAGGGAIDNDGLYTAGNTAGTVTISVAAGAFADEARVTVTLPKNMWAVTSFTLINADTDKPIGQFELLKDGAVLDLAKLPTKNLNIRANTLPAKVGSVQFRTG